ncbi:hypothetical protein HY945_05635 [Candidatus Gottesmanbacteria bacterium]|nr:hypothetical protein [Candidatus Gottesmanbacteria bacterium]
MNTNVATKDDIKRMETKLDKLQNTLDGFVGVVDDLRTDNTVGTYQTRELREIMENHEKRLKHLESSKQIS